MSKRTLLHVALVIVIAIVALLIVRMHSAAAAPIGSAGALMADCERLPGARGRAPC